MSVDFSQFRHLVVPEGEVLSITDASGREIWRRRYVDRVPLSIGTDGKVYNGVGYKTGLRLSGSSGEERDNGDASVTGFIKVKSGDVVRMRWDGGYNPHLWENDQNGGSASSFVYYDSSFGWLGSAALNGSYGICKASDKPTGMLTNGGVVTGVVPANAKIAYMRVSVGITNAGYNEAGQWVSFDQSLEPLIVAVNEEMED